jgi:hypothetical protein
MAYPGALNHWSRGQRNQRPPRVAVSFHRRLPLPHDDVLEAHGPGIQAVPRPPRGLRANQDRSWSVRQPPSIRIPGDVTRADRKISDESVKMAESSASGCGCGSAEEPSTSPGLGWLKSTNSAGTWYSGAALAHPESNPRGTADCIAVERLVIQLMYA